MLAKIDGIDKTLTSSLNTLQVETTNCFTELNASMQRFVKEAVEEFANQKMSAPVKEIVKKEIAVFTVQKSKHNM